MRGTNRRAAVGWLAAVMIGAACADAPDAALLGPAEAVTNAQADVGVLAVPVNDDFDDATVIDALPYSDTTSTVLATSAADDPSCAGTGHSVWYVYTPATDGQLLATTLGSNYDTTLGAYTGTRGDLTELACNDDAGGLYSTVLVDVTAGVPVYFKVGSWSSTSGGTLVFRVEPAPPPIEGILTIDPVGSVDPKTGIATIGITFSCSRPAIVVIQGVLTDRIGRALAEARVGAYAGVCEQTITWQAQVAAANVLLVGGPVDVALQAGFRDLLTGVVTVIEERATVRLRGTKQGSGKPAAADARSVGVLSVPANDEIDDAVVVTELPFSDTIDTAGATTGTDDPPSCTSQGHTVWYAYTPAETGTVLVTTFGSNFDTVISAYTGTPGDLALIACNDQAGGTDQSAMLVDVTAGQPVYLMVGSWTSMPGGTLLLNIQTAPPQLDVAFTIDRTGSIDQRTGLIMIRGTVACSRAAIAQVAGTLTDRIGRLRVDARFSAVMQCEGTSRWEAVAVPRTGALPAGGPADVQVRALFYDPLTGTVIERSQVVKVRLRGGKLDVAAAR